MVLYRKYRPRKFSEVINQKHIKKILLNELKAGKISHAYLFAGPRGSGKTTIARLLAKALNCQDSQNGEPCNKCQFCKAINQGRALDLIEIDAASHRGIDEIRKLREGIKFSPTNLKYKVFIIDEAHQLTKPAFNALLKTLEEPPEHAIFILATTEPHKIIQTIRSRCQRFDFHKLEIKDIVGLLSRIAQKEKVEIGEKSLCLIAGICDGDLRDAISLLDKVISIEDQKITLQEVQTILGTSDLQKVVQLVGFISRQKTKDGLKLINQLNQEGVDLHQYTESLLGYFRKLTMLKINPSLKKLVAPELTNDQLNDMLELAENFSEKKLLQILQIILRANNQMKSSPFPQLPLEMAVVEISIPSS